MGKVLIEQERGSMDNMCYNTLFFYMAYICINERALIECNLKVLERTFTNHFAIVCKVVALREAVCQWPIVRLVSGSRG